MGLRFLELAPSANSDWPRMVPTQLNISFQSFRVSALVMLILFCNVLEIEKQFTYERYNQSATNKSDSALPPQVHTSCLQKSHVPPQFNEQALDAEVTTFGSNASKKVNTSSPMMSTPNRGRFPSTGTVTSVTTLTASRSAETSRTASEVQPSMRLLNSAGHFKPAACARARSGKRGAQGSCSQSATMNVMRRLSADS